MRTILLLVTLFVAVCGASLSAPAQAQAQAAAPVPAAAPAPAPAQAQDSLLIGRVERVQLTPTDADGCPPPCAAAIAAHGPNFVCVSNAGGCQRTDFNIEQVLLGSETVGPRTFEARIGEFGGHDFPVTHAPILVHAVQGSIHWSPLVERDGKLAFYADKFKRDTIGGVPVAALAADENGEVALDSLLARMHAPR